MQNIDVSLFADIADALALPGGAALIEKDYWAVQLLKQLIDSCETNWELCFAGGTCLAKAHLPTYRMSEDLDIKIIPKLPYSSRSHAKHSRKKLKSTIYELIEKHSDFNIINYESRNEGAFKCFEISYPKAFANQNIRPDLKLELVEIDQHMISPISTKVGSIYADYATEKSGAEIQSIYCDKVETILVEKLLSLLRRTAEVSRGYIDPEKEDLALVRHVYDLYLICKNGCDVKLVTNIFPAFLENEVIKFGNRHLEFKKDPNSELIHGLKEISSNNEHQKRYAQYLEPFVYHSNAPSWDEGIESLRDLAKLLLADI